jgi:putative toxin-antitoxin system antitoxin component (TIGR02293 family)
MARHAKGAGDAERVAETAAPVRAGGPHAYAGLLGLRRLDAASLQQRVLEGLPYAALQRLQGAIELTTADLAELVQIKPRTMARRRREGRLLPAESDRLLRAARVWGLALGLCDGDDAAARRWLSAPSRALGGKPPLEVARTEIGAREVEQLVGRLEHGVIT